MDNGEKKALTILGVVAAAVLVAFLVIGIGAIIKAVIVLVAVGLVLAGALKVLDIFFGE